MISWRIPTYGRVSTLEETLFSFLQQTDEDTECVIVNDYSLQTLIFEHPRVRIFNLKETFHTIGDKENFTIEQCKGNIIAVTDDDDVYMPNHNANIRKHFTPETNVLHWHTGVYYNEPEITSITNIGNSGMAFSKEAWKKIGKSPIMNAGGDSVFRDKIHKLGGIVNVSLPHEEVSAFYRWSMPTARIYHQSGAGFDVADRPNIISRHSAHIEALRLKGIIPTGEILLKPHWNYDYCKLLKEFVEKEKAPK